MQELVIVDVRDFTAPALPMQFHPLPLLVLQGGFQIGDLVADAAIRPVLGGGLPVEFPQRFSLRRQEDEDVHPRPAPARRPEGAWTLTPVPWDGRPRPQAKCERRKFYGDKLGDGEARDRIRAMRPAGSTLQAISDALNADGTATRYGAVWMPMTVERVAALTLVPSAAPALLRWAGAF